MDLMANDFKTLVSKFPLVGFIVGYPFNLQGQATADAIQVRLFVEELQKTGKLNGLNYTYWDENFTSKCVEALLDPLNLQDPVETKTMTDKFAAVCILQIGFLSDRAGDILRATYQLAKVVLSSYTRLKAKW